MVRLSYGWMRHVWVGFDRGAYGVRGVREVRVLEKYWGLWWFCTRSLYCATYMAWTVRSGWIVLCRDVLQLAPKVNG